MNSARRQEIDRIFTRALELDENQRQAFIEESSSDDAIRHEVQSLLSAATSAPGQFDDRLDVMRQELWADVLNEDEAAGEDLSGQRVGHWLIGDRLARGGLATVYLARRDDGEFEQTVAFKVLRRGLDTDDVVARFRAERQILSSLDHPSIARIFDGGALPDGRPYLVLEYIDGEQITTWSESNRVDIRGCVRLIIEVLQALDHAHKHLVVHRDIKPSNILVSNDGHVSLLDFGIAKLLDPDAIPGTATLTRTGVSLLTPGYGSPEQRAGASITTASDIYQVGMVLCELLTGQRPAILDNDDVSAAPSKKLQGTSRYRSVQGDLDAIVLKAMHVDPARRYASAAEMVADLERYLDGRAVMAQPDTYMYRLRKLTRRKPWLLPTAAIILFGIATYIVTLTTHSRELQLEQQRAEAAQKFLVDILSSPDPFTPADPERGREITVLEALEIGRGRLETELQDQPVLQANLLTSIADVYRSLDQNEPAIELGEQALALNLKWRGEGSEATLENMRLLGEVYNTTGDIDRARDFFERQLSIARDIYVADDARLSDAEVTTGIFEVSQGNLEIGRQLLASGIDRLREAPAENAETFISATVAMTEHDGLFDSEQLHLPLEEALAVAESVYGPQSLFTANVLLGIARVSVYLQEYDRAKENYSIGLEIYEAQLGPLHGSTIAHLNNYGFMLMAISDYAGGEAVHRDLVERLTKSRGENHRLVADNYQNLASAIYRQGRLEEALPMHRKAYEIYSMVLDQDHYISMYPLLSIAYIELQRDNAMEAEAAAAIALENFRTTVPGSFLEGVATCLVGLAKEKQGKIEEGTAMVEASHPMLDPQALAGSPYTELCRVRPD